ncbi:MAG: alpha/beta hydrolase [Bacillota bacterium]
MKRDSDTAKYLKVKKVVGIRMRTKLGEEAGERILRPMIAENVEIKEFNYLGDSDSFHDCDFIYCEDGVKNKPLMIYIHGGGWTVGSKEARRGMLSVFAEQGFFVVSMNYTLCPEAERFQQIREIYSCTDFAISKSNEYGFESGGVFFCGDSAGGHLATLASVYKNNSNLAKLVNYNFENQYKIVGVAPICGVFDFRTVLSCKFMFMKKYLWAYGGKIKPFLKSERSFLESPLNFPKDFPPCFIVMGENDKLKKQSEELVFALAKEGKQFKIYVGKGKGGFHVFPIMFTTAMAKECLCELGEYLKSLQ